MSTLQRMEEIEELLSGKDGNDWGRGTDEYKKSIPKVLIGRWELCFDNLGRKSVPGLIFESMTREDFEEIKKCGAYHTISVNIK